ncbi:NAD-dependent epimerase/dehydratase family protein [Cellulomonas alba]|uniref:NAD-dependent epimerase/dehydratase family protein n=1 Tax=Cellulomonas alba TaxID=3053467 RepID=A0ABT7SDB3_9CELL|nr:NAD-dependent epimerase/dehydratase family protein [Cellulomonas alba]MDM7854181.1 NAD-dependent epimerase/dehydratase family protein [Cellulomonas alba]
MVVVGRGPVAAAVARSWPGSTLLDDAPAADATAHGARAAGVAPTTAAGVPSTTPAGSAAAPRAAGGDPVPAAPTPVRPTALEDAFAGADVVVLVALPGEPVRGHGWHERQAALVSRTQRLLAAARSAKVRHVVAVTSAVVHGARPDRPLIHDDEPLQRLDDAARDGLVGDLLAVESVLARAARRRSPLLTVLRPAAVVGRGVDTFVTRHFEAPRLLTVRGAVREWQFVHVDDLAAAARLVVERRMAGTFTVGAPDVLTPTQVEAASGMRRIELAPATAFGTAERLHRVGVLPSASGELAFVVYPWTVASDGLIAAGWAPAHSSAQCLDVLLEGVQGRLAVAGRRVGARDAAALGAAGAAVALIGTAAIWRQARHRRGR